MTTLGWQGGTIHDACREIGVEVHDFLYSPACFDDSGPCAEFRRGYEEAKDALSKKCHNQGALQYWFGVVAAVKNDYATVEESK